MSHELNLLKVLYEQDVSTTSLADISNQMRHDGGKKGVFLAKIITNIAKKQQDAMDVAAGIYFVHCRENNRESKDNGSFPCCIGNAKR